MRVEIYWNLHKKCFSVRRKGVVIAHGDSFSIRQPEFVVRPAGHAKVLKEKRKNVHAFVRGILYETDTSHMECDTTVSYNPYKGAYFYDKSTGDPITDGVVAYLRVDKENKPWIHTILKGDQNG